MLIQYSNNLYEVLKHIDEKQFQSVFELVKQANSIFIIGNGGSQSIAEHYAVDLIKFGNKKAYTISNTALLTMSANDFGYDHSFSWVVNHYCQKNDLIFAMSTSGISRNILRTIVENVSSKAAFLTGLGGIDFEKNVDAMLVVPSMLPQVIEDCFSVICHTITIMLKNGEKR